MSSGCRCFKFLVVLAAVSIGSGCVYYNTFFLARQNFNNAEKSQEENRLSKLRLDDQSSTNPGNNNSNNNRSNISLPNTPPPRNQPGVLTSTVTQQERTLYEDAITKANVVLTLHPDSKWVDDALWLIGKSNFNMGEFSKAEKSLKELVTNHPESKFADDAYFYLGLSQISLDLNDQALSAFANIENAPKKSPYLEYVMFAKGNMEMDDENYDEAADMYSKFLESYSSSDSAAVAMFNIGQCREKKKNYLGAYEAFSKVDKYSPSRRLHFDAALASATAAIAGDSVAIGMKILDVLSKDDRYFSRAGEINLKSAEGYYLEGDLDNAIKLYTDVTVQNPRTALSAEAYYRLGVIYQDDKNDLVAAKDAFSKSQGEFGDTEFRGLALARSAQIAKLETYQTQLQRADSLSKVEELESLGQAEPEFIPPDSTLKSQSTIQPQQSLSDSTLAVKGDSLSLTSDTLAIPKTDSQSTVSIAPAIAKPDSLSSIVIADGQTVSSPPPISHPADSLAQNAPLDTLKQKREIVQQIFTPPKIDTSGFGKITFADRIRQALGKAEADSLMHKFALKTSDSLALKRDSLTVMQDSILAMKKDTLAVTKGNESPAPNAVPAVSPKAIQDSIRQAIIQAGIETRFLLAELYAYELNRPDSALQEYLLIVKEFPESRFAPKALLAASQIKTAKGDSMAARDLLNQLISNYSESPQADQAAKLLSSPVNPQNAMELYSSAENLVFSGENPDSGVILYQYIARNFPDLSAKAAYAAAWTLDQVIGVEDSSAYYAYSAITKNYPQTEYAAAATDRISAASKKSARKSALSNDQNPADSSAQMAESDSLNGLAMDLPLAPNVTKPGVFLYPEPLLSQDLRGKVIFKIKLNFSGKVEDYQLIGPFGERLIDSTATAALLQTEFDVSSLDLSQLDGYFQYSISFKRPELNMYNNLYQEQREQGP